MTSATDQELVARIQDTRAAVADHKRAIREHKKALSFTAAELETLEAESRRRGLRIIFVHKGAEGAIPHGRPEHS